MLWASKRYIHEQMAGTGGGEENEEEEERREKRSGKRMH